MRTSVGFTSTSPPSSSTTTATTTSSSTHTIPSSHSPWHSPVPYLFGGLAAMLGLIAFALLILACSYWKLSGYLDGEDDSENPSASGDGAGGKGGDGKAAVGPTVYEERIVVIMAGDAKPTFLAMPITSRASSFAHSCSSKSMEGGGSGNEGGDCDKINDEDEDKKSDPTGDSNGRQQEEEEEEESQTHSQSEQ